MADRYYDKKNNRLVYINREANSDFWNLHWRRYDVQQAVKTAVFNRLIMAPTRKYLQKGGRILEGGCGLGQHVWTLAKSGYDVYGVDYAETTVRRVKDALPELNVSCQDIRALDFRDNFFDGYWSLGVIEHFYDGYDRILMEMKRVLRSGGYLFMTFPCMSKYRQLKSQRNRYRVWCEDYALIPHFYQFALSDDSVRRQCERYGFKLIESRPTGGLKGFKDEVESQSLKKMLQGLYDSKLLPLRGFAWMLDHVLSPFSGHSRLMVFKSVK